MKKRIILLLIFVLTLAACNNAPEVDLDATIAAGIAATQAAAPLPTAAPTDTPTATPLPDPTATPTDEPEPTATLVPTEEPTPEPEPVEEPTEEVVAPSVIKTNSADGTVLYEVVADQFSIELPGEWRSADFSDLQVEEIFDGIADQNEELSDLFSSDYFQNLAAAGVKFYAVNVANTELLTLSPPVINVIVQELPFAFTLTDYIDLNVTQLNQYFDLTSEIEQRDLMLGDVEATMLQYSANLTDPLGRPLELTNTQYLLLQDETAYVVTLAVPRDTKPEALAEFMQSAETFRLLEQP